MDEQNNVNPIGNSGNSNSVGDNNVNPTMENSNYSSNSNSTNNTVYEATPINNDSTNSNVNGASKESPHALNIVSLIFGILSLVCCCLIKIGFICAIVAVITGILGRKHPGKGLGTAGMVCGIIAIVLKVILVFVIIKVFNTAMGTLPGIFEQVRSAVESGSGAVNIESGDIEKILEEISNFDGIDSFKRIFGELLEGGLSRSM